MTFELLDRTQHSTTAPATATASTAVERIHADHTSVKRLGNWTEAARFELRGRSGSIVLDLRSPRLPKTIDIEVRLDRAMVKLLLPDNAVVEHWDLDWTGRGKVKDAQAQATATAEATAEAAADVTCEATAMKPVADRVRLSGGAQQRDPGEPGGIAQLAALCSREFIEDARCGRTRPGPSDRGRSDPDGHIGQVSTPGIACASRSGARSRAGCLRADGDYVPQLSSSSRCRRPLPQGTRSPRTRCSYCWCRSVNRRPAVRAP